MSQSQILGRRPFPFKAILIRFAYANFPGTIAGAVRRPLVGAFVRRRSGELVGLLVEHGVDGFLTGSSNDTIGLDMACLLA